MVHYMIGSSALYKIRYVFIQNVGHNMKVNLHNIYMADILNNVCEYQFWSTGDYHTQAM